MRVKPIDIIPGTTSPADIQLTPQLLASVFGRMSRSDKSVADIVGAIDLKDEEKSIERIMSYQDYGHSSLGDMCPIAMEISNVSILASFFILNICQEGGFQEQSTRYIKQSDPVSHTRVMKNNCWSSPPFIDEFLGIGLEEHFTKLFEIYNVLREEFSKEYILPDNPTPLETRLANNWGMDRAREALPIGSTTGLGLVMSARNWNKLIIHLLSAPETLPELKVLGGEIYDQLQKVAPHMVRGYVKTQYAVGEAYWNYILPEKTIQVDTFPFSQLNLDMHLSPAFLEPPKFPCYRTSRHSPIPIHHANTSCVLHGQMPFSSIRELNRHRTGVRCPGLYQLGLPITINSTNPRIKEAYLELRVITQKVIDYYIKVHHPAILYLLPLGTTMAWSHTTTLDKMLHEIELRSEEETHFSIREHMRQLREQVYGRYPGLRIILK